MLFPCERPQITSRYGQGVSRRKVPLFSQGRTLLQAAILGMWSMAMAQGTPPGPKPSGSEAPKREAPTERPAKPEGRHPKTRPAAVPTVAVLYFDYTGKDPNLEPLRKGLARMLISDLSANTAFQIVERERLEEVLAELKLSQSKAVDPKTATRIGKLLSVHYLVLGGYFELAGQLRIDARLVEVETGKVIRSTGYQRKPEDFLELEQKIALDLASALAAAAGVAPQGAKERPSRPAPVEPAVPHRTVPPLPKRLRAEVVIRYGRALDAKDRGDRRQARAELRKVIEMQPDFSLAKADLAALAK